MTKITYNNPVILKGLAVMAITLSNLTALAQTAHIVVDAAKVVNKIPSKLYGSCIEDVNHEIYGGLYDQRLYGESFEEPAPPTQITGWKALQGDWKVANGDVFVKAGPGYKLIKENLQLKDGSVEADLKFGHDGENAGFIIRVNNAQAGMDDFDGYEINIAPGRQMLVLGKHVHNFKLLKETKIAIDRNNWLHLKVSVKGGQIAIYLNNDNNPALEFTDDEAPLLTGKIGLRTFHADVVFKNLVINQNGTTINNEFVGKESLQISSVWDGITSPLADVKFALDTTDAYNSKQAQVINYIKGAGKVGIANNGLNRWGIAVKKGQKFQGYVFLKGAVAGPVTVALQNADGSKTYATQQFVNITSNWKKYPFTLITNGTNIKARFAIYIDKKGKLEVDQAVLMGTGSAQFKGLPLRADIATKMQQEGLNFVRYGGTMVNAPDYKWKNMVGHRDKRPMYEGHWYPYTSNGFGIEEFVAYCEAAGFDPAFAINVEEKPADIADMLEYLTGSITTPWGKKRAEYGHAKPYKLKYIELGNEEVIWDDLTNDYKHYAERFNLLYNVIHAKNPEIKVICAAWWRPKSEANMELVFKAVNGKASYWDLHTDADDANAGKVVDRSLQTMHDLFLKWDPTTQLKCTIFEENGGLHNMQRALGHATTLNAVRRHGDFVLTSCAANGLQGLGQNDNDWDQGQIFFTPSQVWGMPPFYATQMMAKNHEPLRVFNSVDGNLDVTATRDEKSNQLVLHIVNTSASATKTTIDIKGFTGRKSRVKVYTLSGDPKAENTPQNPAMIATKETMVQLAGNIIAYDFPANSYIILRFEK
jgi:alpha-L-arabinofuranosidase